MQCSDIDNTWTIYYPQYKHWYNVFWQYWIDSFYGNRIHRNNQDDAEQFILDQKRRQSYNETTINTISI